MSPQEYAHRVIEINEEYLRDQKIIDKISKCSTCGKSITGNTANGHFKRPLCHICYRGENNG